MATVQRRPRVLRLVFLRPRKRVLSTLALARSPEEPLRLGSADRDRGKALFTTHRWIVRRVESVQLRDALSVTRALTIDYEVPRGVADPSQAPIHLPLMLLRKAPPVLDVDLRDEEDRSLPLLSKRENARLSAHALMSMLEFALDQPVDAEVRELCRRVAREDPAPARLTLEELSSRIYALPAPMSRAEAYRRKLRVRRVFQLARTMAGNSVIWVPNSASVGERRIVKFSYLGRQEIVSSLRMRLAVFLGIRSLHVFFETPHMRGCRSYHFEATLPNELELHGEQLHADLRPALPGTTVQPLAHFKQMSRDLHLYLDLVGTTTYDSRGVSFRVRAGRRGFLSFALCAGWLIAAMLWTGFALNDKLVGEPASQAVPPMLLVIPAVLIALVNRPEEHPFSAYLLTGTRYLILLSGVIASAAAGVLAFVADPATSEELEVAWAAAAVACTAIAILLLVGWIASMPARSRAMVWGSISAVALVVVAVVLTLLGQWNAWTAHLPVVIALAIAYCVREARRTRQMPRYQGYFAAHLRAQGVLPPSTDTAIVRSD